MFKHMSIKGKFVAVCTVLSAFSLTSGGIAYYGLRTLSAEYGHVTRVNMPGTLALSQMKENYESILSRLNHVVARGTTEAERAEAVAGIASDLDDYLKAEKLYAARPATEADKSRYDSVSAAWSDFYPVMKRAVTLARSRDPGDLDRLAETVMRELRSRGARYSKAVDELIAYQTEESRRWTSEAESTAGTSNVLNVLVVIVGVLAAQLIGMFFSSSISRQLQALADKLGRGADGVAESSRQVSDAGAQLSSGATEQAAALQQTVASLDQVSAMVSKSADNARQSQSLSATSHEAAVKGKNVVDEMIRSIEEINQSNTEIMQQIETSNREMSEIVKVIAEIGNKTKVINDIVFQTKLLSFNASVEAARAGEHGKGFAVVAEEVGNLAAMSGNAAKEISSMLEGSIQKVEGIVTQTKTRVERLVVTGKAKVQAGTTTAKRCGEVLDEIVTHVNNVSQMVAEIATACGEQATGVQEITKAMGQLDQVTQQNASASQQTARASESLSSQSEELRSLVRDMAATIQGSGAPAAPAAAERSAPAARHVAPVIPITRKAARKAAASTPRPQPVQHAIAVGGAPSPGVVPSENDPRFEDV